jgi:phosphatidylglycerol:prolipoprotein diacylglycerol transferase
VLSVLLDGVRRHPVQLYEAIVNLILFALLVAYRPGPRRAGARVALYLTTYPVARFFLEFLRGDSRRMGPEFNVAQWVSLGLFVTGCLLWAAGAAKGREPGTAGPA